MKVQSKPIDYLTNEDLIQKLGYKTYKPKLGELGRAITEASKANPQQTWLKHQLDRMFEAVRRRTSTTNGKKGTSDSRANDRHRIGGYNSHNGASSPVSQGS